MDTWAPVVRIANQGTGQLTNDAGSVVTTLGPFTPSANNADSAAHGTVGDQWLDAYGEVTIPATVGGASSKVGMWLRVTDSSNYYALYRTSAGNVAIDSVVAGANTSLLSTAVAEGSMPGVLRGEVRGDAISVWWRGSLVDTVRDGSLTAKGYVSMFLRSTSGTTQAQISRFEAGPLGVQPGVALPVQVAGPRARARAFR